MLADVGVTTMDCNTAAVTVNCALPIIFPSVAETVDVPLDSDLTRPAGLTEATAEMVELHVGDNIT